MYKMYLQKNSLRYRVFELWTMLWTIFKMNCQKSDAVFRIVYSQFRLKTISSDKRWLGAT